MLDKQPGRELLNDRAQGALFTALREGGIRSGQFLSMPQLVEFLEFPIAAVRDAVKYAESFGLVEILPKRGVLVMEAGPEITRHCMDLRSILDQEGARRRIAQGNLEGLTALRKSHEELRQRAESAPDNLSDEAITTDLTLHEFLAQGLGNPMAERSYAINGIRISVIQNTRPFVKNRIVPAMEEHLAIMEGLESGDADRTCEAIREHHRHTLDWWGL